MHCTRNEFVECWHLSNGNDCRWMIFISSCLILFMLKAPQYSSIRNWQSNRVRELYVHISFNFIPLRLLNTLCGPNKIN